MKIRSRSPAQNKQLREILRNNLYVFHVFCEKHNLTYYLSDGTLLGAIRHKDIIPWDDDADVCMPRDDYNKLIKLADQLPYPYKLGHFSIDKDYIHPFIKLINTETEIIEFIGNDKIKTGVWLDIFPLDATYNNIILRKIHYKVTFYLRLLFLIKCIKLYVPKRIQRKTLKSLIQKYLLLLAYILVKSMPRTFFSNIMDICANHKNYIHTKYVGNIYTHYGIKGSYRKDVFNSKILTEFGQYQFYIPAGYDEYLKGTYGDYMTPLQPSDRNLHSFDIIKLD